jgi:YegS/Rv2252/BmrU family lipid kinase
VSGAGGTPSGARPGHDAPMAPRRIALIANPSAGGGKTTDLLPAVEDRLRALGQRVETLRTDTLEHGRQLALQAWDRGELPVVLSGDGLVGAVAAALSEVPDAEMGVLPGGRGNDFARVAGIPLDPLEACEVVAHGVARPFDLGVANGVPFLGIASLGFDSEANRLANEAPRQFGQLAYAYAALRALAGWRHARFTVEVDGDRRSFAGWSVVIANSQAYGGGMFIAPNADLHDGELDVVLTSASGKLTFLRSLPKVFRGTHVQLSQVHELRGRTVRVSADRPFVVYADGDPIGELPMTVTAKPDAIRIVVAA